MAKLNAAGSGLDYATFIGGTTYAYIENDYAHGIAIDSDGAVFIAGYTESPDFPITPGAFDPSYNGGDFDAFALKLNESGSALDYATYLGGNDTDWGAAVAIDTFGPRMSPAVPGLLISPPHQARLIPVTTADIMTLL